MFPILGLHHVTAIAGDAAANVRFYSELLGLRLVKKTVNFDDPFTYHLYYGDRTGSPGSTLTFFPWQDVPKGRTGLGMITATAFAVPPKALDFWRKRLAAEGVMEEARFGEPVLRFSDPDGMPLEIVGTTTADAPNAGGIWGASGIDPTDAIRGLHSVTATVGRTERTAAILTGVMGFEELVRIENRTRYVSGVPGARRLVDVVEAAGPSGLQGAGTVHHVAFDIAAEQEQLALRTDLVSRGMHVSPVMDRTYFRSIYFREPNGILFEVATSGPGFGIDESPAELGTHLRLPPQYETMREAIEAKLPDLDDTNVR